jgi:GMP synthase (glutamine-hydrolysing)
MDPSAMDTYPDAASRPRIALLDASHTVETTRRNFRRELDAELDEFHCPSGDLPSGFGYDGLVITGSSASVYWDRKWIRELKHWVKAAVDVGLPALGICYGHQLLADVTGGRVEDMGEYEIGYRTVEHTGHGMLFDGIPDAMTVFTTHSDRVAALPPGGTVLAANDYGIQSFCKDRVYGVQFHPEYDLQTARMITEGKDGQLSDTRLQQVLDGIHTDHYEAACEVKSLFDNFLTNVQARMSQRAMVG